MIHSFRIDIQSHLHPGFDKPYFNYRITERDDEFSEEKVFTDRSGDSFPSWNLAMDDALLYMELVTMRGPGRWRVWYMRQQYFETFIMGTKPPLASTLMQTHRALRCVDVPAMEQVFGYMQAENWSPNNEAVPLILRKGLYHTSMSVGDVIEDLETGEFYAIAFAGFTKL